MTPPKRLFTATVVLAFLCLASATTAKADTVNFNFEQLSATGMGALTTLTLAQGGLTMTLTRESNERFDIFNNESTFPDAWGATSLAPFTPANTTSANTAFIANFSQPLSSISIDMGDGGQDADMLLLEIYSGFDGTGLMGTATANLAGGGVTFTFANLSLTANGIQSIRFIGGSSSFPNSVLYDNISVTFAPQAVPEPTTMVLLGMGLAGMALKGFRSRKTARHEACRSGM